MGCGGPSDWDHDEARRSITKLKGSGTRNRPRSWIAHDPRDWEDFGGPLKELVLMARLLFDYRCTGCRADVELFHRHSGPGNQRVSRLRGEARRRYTSRGLALSGQACGRWPRRPAESIAATTRTSPGCAMLRRRHADV